MEATKRWGIFFLAVAAILALVTGLVVMSYINEKEREIGERIEVVVAKQAIPARTLITADMLEMQEIPKRLARDSYILDPEDVLQDTVALVDIEAGDILQRNMLDRNAGLKPGMRAVSVGVNRVTGVGGTVRPGNRVDVIVSYKEAGFGEQNTKTVLLFQDVEVLGVSYFSPSARRATAEGAQASAAAQTMMSAAPARFSATGNLLNEATVTLALPIEDAMKLAWMENFGEEIRLVIRRLDEKEVPAVPMVTIDAFK